MAARPGLLLVTAAGPVDGLRPVAESVGAEEVVDLAVGEAVLLDRLADTIEPAAPARMIGVLPGRGGAGASVLATALALTAAGRGGPAWLVDLDPLGGGADVGLGAELAAGARWSDLGTVSGRLSSTALRAAVPEVHGVAVVSSGRELDDPRPDTVRTVLAAARRGGGTVVLDLPRYGTEARDAAVTVADELVVVVPAELRAVLAGELIVDSLRPTGAALRAIARSVPDGLPAPEVSRGIGLEVTARLPDEVQVRRALLTGDAPGLLRAPALKRVCASLLDLPVPRRAAA
jgi:secretion/DNA translocation related CpaE-like protein